MKRRLLTFAVVAVLVLGCAGSRGARAQDAPDETSPDAAAPADTPAADAPAADAPASQDAPADPGTPPDQGWSTAQVDGADVCQATWPQDEAPVLSTLDLGGSGDGSSPSAPAADPGAAWLDPSALPADPAPDADPFAGWTPPAPDPATGFSPTASDLVQDDPTRVAIDSQPTTFTPSGDTTLASLGTVFGVAPGDLAQANPGLDGGALGDAGTLAAGTTINLPEGAPVRSTALVADPSAGGSDVVATPIPGTGDPGTSAAASDPGASAVTPDAAASPPADTPVTRRGDSGDAVKRIQEAVGATPDGDFGPGMQAAVKQFQRDHGLTPDGVVGPATWAAINGGSPGGSSSGGSSSGGSSSGGRGPSGGSGSSGGSAGGSSGGSSSSGSGSSGGNGSSGGSSTGSGDTSGQAPDAPSGSHDSARGTGYYPSGSLMEGGFKDRKGAPLYTLQAYLAGNAPYVSVAMDSRAFSYGTSLRIPELEREYGRQIDFRVVDTGGAFVGRGTSRIDICTANNSAAHDSVINGRLTLYPQ